MTPDALEQLRTELVDGIATRRRRARSLRWRATVGMAAAALVAVVSLAAWGPSGGNAALAISDTERWVELRIADASAGPEQMNRELRDAGIDAEVRLVPVPAELVGKWVGIETKPVPADQMRPGSDRQRDREDVAELEQVRLESPDLVRIPASFEGHVVLLAGRKASPGEPCTLPVGCPGTKPGIPPAQPRH